MSNSFMNPWIDYLELEQQFLDFIKYVPLSDEHFNIWSPKLANLSLSICSTIDSFFQYSILFIDENKDKLYDLEKYAENITPSHVESINSNNSNIGIYREVFENVKETKRTRTITYLNDISLSNKIVYTKNVGIDSPEMWIIPFFNFGNGKSPNWWYSYTDLKHDKYNEIKKTTLYTTLNALAGLFLLNITTFDNQLFLKNKNVLNSSFNKGDIVTPLNTYYDYDFNNYRDDDLNYVFGESKLFIYVFGLKNIENFKGVNSKYFL